MALTPKQKRFVDEYLKDLNATQAAIRAGYAPASAHVQGPRALGYDSVKAEIERRQARRAKRTEVSQDRVIRELVRIAFADLRNVVEWGEGGVVAKDSSLISDDAAAAISEIAQTQHGLRIKTHNKMSALDLLGKHLGMFQGGETSPEEAARMLARAFREMADADGAPLDADGAPLDADGAPLDADGTR